MKNSREVIEKRQYDILNFLRVHSSATVTLLAEEMEVTPATIRRDLQELTRENIIAWNHGYATYLHQDNMERIEPTDIEDKKELIRRRIAKVAADMIKDGDVIFINSSGTASLVMEYLNNINVTVVSNNARIVNRNLGSQVQLILTGGLVFGKKQSMVGQYAVDVIKHVAATKCILGISGISATGGFTSQILPETEINNAMLRQCSGPRIIVAEGSKIGSNQSFFSGRITDATHLITDTSANKNSLKEIEELGIKVICV